MADYSHPPPTSVRASDSHLRRSTNMEEDSQQNREEERHDNDDERPPNQVQDHHRRVVIRAGPSGNQKRGKAWSEIFPGFIDRILVSYGTSIRSIQILYRTIDGELILMPKHGGEGTKFTSIQFKNGECLTKISGYLSYWQRNIKSIKFETESAIYGPYGKEEGTPFLFEIKDGVINGFHGRSDKTRLRSIGILIDTNIPKPDSLTKNTSCFGFIDNNHQQP